MDAGTRAATDVEEAGGRPSWKVFGILVAASVICSLLVVPYSMSLLGQGEQLEISAWAFVVGGVIQGLVFTGIAAGLGLWLGPKVGLGAQDLRAWFAGDPEVSRRIRGMLPLAVGLGLATGVVLLVLGIVTTPLMPEELRDVTHPPAWQGFLAAISAGVNEEIWLRLGLMTFFVWLGAKLLRQEELPAVGVVWTAILLATLLFGALHLPQAAVLAEGLTGAVVAVVLLLNGLAGVVFGWLYWRRGLVAAMVAHFATDIVLHVIAPAVGLIPTT